MIQHILSADQFNQNQIAEIFGLADEFKSQIDREDSRKELATRYRDRQLCTLFYQPSTRTRLSFETAALKLGLGVVSTEDALSFSSAAKGETLEDTVRVLNLYHLDIIVLRYNEVGGAKRAAAVSHIPIVNGGDGPGEHPTQALLDAYTIKQFHGRLDNLKVVMGGDLKYSRTVRSLVHLLSKYSNNHITFTSVPRLQIGADVKAILKKTGTSFAQTDSMHEAFKDADVVYWTRLQKEYLKLPSGHTNGGFVIDKKALKVLPKKAIIMHPLPRVDEITEAIDADPRAKYFVQAGNGLYIRMALIDKLLKKQF